MSDRDMVRLEELLIDRSLGSLGAVEAEELRDLLARHPDADESAILEAVLGEMTAALASEDVSEMPADVAARVVQAAADVIPAERIDQVEGNSTEPGDQPDRPDITPIMAPGRGQPAWVAAGGWVAAAAAIAGWFLVPNAFRPAPEPPAVPEPTLADMRDSLVSGGAQLVQIPWAQTGDSAGVAASGEVVWSTALQTGFMTFAGLEVNDPTLFQYQLWIFDGTRDERYPVDGGVFDIGPDGEVIVEITPKVEVREPALFAITIEPPGGVVVSDRERIVLVAAAD